MKTVSLGTWAAEHAELFGRRYKGLSDFGLDELEQVWKQGATVEALTDLKPLLKAPKRFSVFGGPKVLCGT